MPAKAPKFLIDVSLGVVATQWLKDNFEDVVAVRDVDLRMLDHSILAWAVEENRIVITLDKDFGELVYRNNLEHRGILLLRLESETGLRKIEVLSFILNQYLDSLSNSFCVYQNGRIRISSQ
ncbi:MAG: DUF5615 family PIN-like protein [Chloroflexota bacterium]